MVKPGKLASLLSFGHKGYLASIGWFTAFEKKQAVDEHGEPLPWVTYSFIDFIKNRIKKEHHIFEFGSGSSTWFYAARAGSVTSVEHDKAWYEKVKKDNPANAEMIFAELETNGAYSHMAATQQKPFDIVIVDGRDRINCCKNSLAALSDAGVMVLDDSERDIYQEAFTFMAANGFREITFSGISPGLFYLKSTTVFYRDGNCLTL